MEIPLLLYMIILILMIIPNKSLLFSLFVARFPIYFQFMITSIIWQFPYNLLANSLVIFFYLLVDSLFILLSIIQWPFQEPIYWRYTYHILEVPFPLKNGYSHRHHGGALILFMGTGWVMLGHSRRTWRKSWMGIGPGTAWFQVDEILQFNHNICTVKIIFICNIYIYNIYICKNYTYM